MKRILMLPLLLLMLGCSTHSGNNQRQVLDGLNIARDSYATLQNVAKQLHDGGTISSEQWNRTIVPADHAINDALTHAYSLLKVWVATGTPAAYDEYSLAIEEVFRLLSFFRGLTGNPNMSQIPHVMDLPQPLSADQNAAYLTATAIGVSQ